jgi:hypothetical protein
MTNPSDKKLAELAALLGATEGREIDCDTMLSRAAAYLQAVRDRTTLTDHLQQVAQHLNVCPECREEFMALLKAEGLDPAKILPS